MNGTTISIDNSHIEGVFGVTRWYKKSIQKFFEQPQIRTFYPEKNFQTGAIRVAQSQIEVFEKLFHHIIEFSPKEAKKKYRNTLKCCDKLLKINKDLIIFLKEKDILTPELNEYFSKANNSNEEFMKSLKVIAAGEPVNEESEDYRDFMSRITGNEKFENVGNSFEEILNKS